MNSNRPHISVVVCTWNRAESLRGAVHSLTLLNTQDKFSYDILVINNRSTDNTSDVVRELAAASLVPIKEVVEENPGVVHARNRGVEESAGEWIAFFDDDQLADESWLLQLLEIAVEKDCRCVGGSVKLLLPQGESRELSPVCRMLLGETVGMDDAQLYHSRCTPGAGNLMIHRSVFDQVGKFDEAFQNRGEDTNLFLRIHAAKIRAWYTPLAVVHHVIPSERLTPAFLMKLSNIMSHGMAIDERNSVGSLLYPLYWLARLCQTACVIAPRYYWASLMRRHEERLGSLCRLTISKGYLKEGFSLLFGQS